MSRLRSLFSIDRIPSIIGLIVTFLILAVPVRAISAQDYVQNYCYSGWCKFPGQKAKPYSQTAIKEYNEYLEGEEKQKSDGEVNIFGFTSSVAQGVQGALVAATIGPQVKYDNAGGVVYKPGGVVGDMTNAIAFMYSAPPATTQTYIADVLNSAGVGIVQPAYAQGLGFSALNPVLEAWKAFRNIAYLFFVLVILVIGFMIMLRQKVGQAAITAQQAIPSIIVALLAVTFSYAIAGLLIDFMYLLMFLIIGIFGESASLIDTSIFELAVRLIASGGVDAYKLVSDIVGDLVSLPLLEDIGGLIGGITAALVIGIAIAVAVFKLFFELITTYVSILIAVVMSPIQLMFGAIPGRSAVSSWLRNLIGNLMAFPTVLIILLVYDRLTVSGAEDGGFLPPFLIGGADQGDAIPFIIGLGIILALPEAVKKVKQQFGASEGPFGEIIKAGWGRARGALPVGTKAAGAVVGAGVGFGAGLPEAYWRTRGTAGAGTRALQALGVAGRRMGYGAGVGTGLGGRVGGTASEIGWLDSLVSKGGQHFTPEERLKRIAERQNILGRSSVRGKDNWESRRLLAERQAEKKEFEEDRLRRGIFGQAIGDDTSK